MGNEVATPRVWLIRAGGHGEDEDAALSNGVAVISFREASQLDKFKSIEDLFKSLIPAAEGNENRATNWSRQLWAFSSTAAIGDIVALPLKSRPGQIALGRIKGPYKYRDLNGEMRHTRAVDWVRPDCARAVFQQDLLYSFGAFLTVCRITRNNAEARVLEVLSGKTDPGYEVELLKDVSEDESAAVEAPAGRDHEQAARDEIVKKLREKYPGHELARLVARILEAEGYKTQVSPPGPDNGADILAGRGLLGLDGPSLCVQVKATLAAADVKVIRELLGTMELFKAAQGLFVCWGGFTDPARKEARQHAFKLTLWDESDIVNALYRAYPKLSAEIQAELPLKQVWMLVRDET